MNDRRKSAADALAMRRAGMSYRQIARALKCSPKKAWKLVQSELQRAGGESPETATEVLALELERLDALQTALWNEATSGNVAAIDRVLKIMERRARLMNLESAIDVQDAMRRLVEGLARLRSRVTEQTPNRFALPEGQRAQVQGTSGLASGETPQGTAAKPDRLSFGRGNAEPPADEDAEA